MRIIQFLILMHFTIGFSNSYAQTYSDFSAILYEDGKFFILSNDKSNSDKYFVVEDVDLGDLKPNQNYLLTSSLSSEDIETNLNCSPIKNDLESFDSINGDFYFLQERCARL